MSEPVIVFSSEIVDHAPAEAMRNAGVSVLTVDIPAEKMAEKIEEIYLFGAGHQPPPTGLLIVDDPCATKPRQPPKYGNPRPYLKRKKGRS